MYEALVERFWSQPEFQHMRCKNCGETEHVRIRLGGARVAAHVGLAVATKGLWAPMWLIDYVAQKQTWVCTGCDHRRGVLQRYTAPANFLLPHDDLWHRFMGVTAVLLVAAGLMGSRDSASGATGGSAPANGAPVAAQAAAKPQLTAAEAVVEARRALDAWVPATDPAKTDWGDLAKAQALLKLVSPQDLENTEAEGLRAEVARRVGEKTKVFDAQREAAAKAAEAQRQQEARAVEQALKSMRLEKDKMSGYSWYSHPSSPRGSYVNGFYLYFGRSESGSFTPIRLVARYAADDWLFVTTAWAKADGSRVDFPQKSESFMGWERDNAGGSIWEWSDAPLVSAEGRSAVRALANAKSVTVRFEGKQYHGDRTLSAQQLKAMRDVISAYEGATGKPWN